MESGDSACFVCNMGRLLFTSSSMDIPHFGEVSISTFTCSSCGYRSTDVLPVRSLPPSRFYCSISGGASLSIRVIRSHSAVVRIPEIGIRIDPGVAAEGFITNTEGILNRVEGILDHVLRDSYRTLDGLAEEKAENLDRISKCLSLKDRIEKARAGKDVLTLILEDPTGNSAIAGDDPSIVREDLTEVEIIDLLSGHDR